ncbi:hypothetical protein ACHAXR_000915, partial [Thalassiosira sp. AJA248-18]
MACLPYPTFLQSPTQTPSASSLSSVGRVRIHPLTCPGSSGSGGGGSSTSNKSAQDEYQAIISKCKQQSQVLDDTSDDKNKTKENAKLRKKYMKEGVAMASTYLTQTLNMDVSIIDVEIVLNADSILDTDGCLASCFLDAGCAYIVVRVREDDGGLSKALQACDATRVPRERLILHYKKVLPVDEMEGIASKKVGTFSIQFDDDLSTSKTDWNFSPSKEWKTVVQLSLNDNLSNEDLITTVASLSKAIGENKGSITLVDPSAEQLGLCYAACMKTDRPDGLYTTVVCTRSNEALGLVYSSK